MNDAVCKSCGAPIVWAITEKGARMPISKGSERRRFTLDTLTDGTVVCRSVLTYESHFSDCPNADKHRSPR